MMKWWQTSIVKICMKKYCKLQSQRLKSAGIVTTYIQHVQSKPTNLIFLEVVSVDRIQAAQ